MLALASTDELTGAWSRRFGLEEVERTLIRARRERTPLVLTFIDVDTNQPVNHGQLVEQDPVSASGRLYVKYDVSGAEKRSPRAGDLCVKLKQ